MEDTSKNSIGVDEENSMSGNLSASIIDIRGSMYYAVITYDNGYAIKVCGELYPGAKFIASKKSIKRWELPHDLEPLTAKMVAKLILDVEKTNLPDKVNVIFN